MTETTEESWLKARELLSWIGRVPPSFTTPIRTLMIDASREGKLSPASQFLVTRLLRSPSLKAMIYYSALSLHGEKISNTPYLSSVEIMRLFAPAELAAFFSFIFLHRKLKKVELEHDPEQFQVMSNQLLARIEAGFELGRALPIIGPARAVLAGSWRELMLGFFRVNDRNGFCEYSDYLERSGKAFCTEYEEERWGCTHVDLGGNALQLMGMGVGETHGFIQGFAGGRLKSDETQKEAYQYQIAAEWIDALLETGLAPERVHDGDYYPRQQDSYKLLYRVNELRENGPRYCWINCSKEDINPQLTPQLFQEYLLELQEASQVEEFFQTNLPADVLESLSEEDLRELSSAGVGK